MDQHVARILEEIQTVFNVEKIYNQEALHEEIVGAEKIVCVGAGRVGLALAGFAKRLRHLGKDAFWIHDMTLPRMGESDLMIIGSGSGETESIVGFGRIAKREGLRIALVTSSPSSRLKEIADVSVTLPAPRLSIVGTQSTSIQPMTTLFEQCCQVYLDATVLHLMEIMGLSGDQMGALHSGIE